MGPWKKRLTESYVALAVVAALVVALFATGIGGALVAFVGVLAILVGVGFLVYVVARRLYDRAVHSEPLYRGGGGG